MNQAVRNANDGISMVQTAEGALNETSNILLRMRELGTQAANGTLTQSQRDNIEVEFKTLQDEIDPYLQRSPISTARTCSTVPSPQAPSYRSAPGIQPMTRSPSRLQMPAPPP